jgi:hypothetical protein
MHDPVAYYRCQLAPWDIESAWSSTDPWMEHGDQQPWRDARGRGTTTTTNPRLHLLPEWRPLVAEIEHHAGLAWPSLAPPEYRDHQPDLTITELWCNYTDPGQPGADVHSHYNPLAAVYYPEGEDNMGQLYLEGQAVSIEPAGTLILFPGTVDHWVGPNQSSRRRRAVAGNLTLRGVNNQTFVELARAQGRCTTTVTTWRKYNTG